jgi:hypothetical protein
VNNLRAHRFDSLPPFSVVTSQDHPLRTNFEMEDAQQDKVAGIIGPRIIDSTIE